MLEVGMMFDLQRQAISHIQSLLKLEKFLPVMTGEQVREFEEAIKTGRAPIYSSDTLSDLNRRLTDRNNEINAKFREAKNKSNRLCRRKTAKNNQAILSDIICSEGIKSHQGEADIYP